MNDFAAELRELVEAYRAGSTLTLEEMVDALESEAEKMVEEINARADA